VDLDAGHAREPEASLQLLQRDGAQRIGAAEADQPRGVLRHLGGGPVVFLARQPVGIVQFLALVGEAVTDREHDRPIDPGRVELPHQRRAVPRRHFHDRLEAAADQMLVIVGEGRRARCDRSGVGSRLARGEQQ
jgi:hypothetical protein